MKFILLSFGLLSSAATAAAFVVRYTWPHSGARGSSLHASSTVSSGLIRGEDENATPYDEGLGGVRLAQENAVKLVGCIDHKPGKASPVLDDLVRYTQVRQVDEATFQKTLEAAEATLICTGKGTEAYKDPGETIVADISLAPMAAVRDALFAAGSVKDSTRIVLNVLGGEDMQLLEVTDALVEMVLDLDCNTKAKIEFNSLAHNIILDSSATITVVAVEGNTGGNTGVEKSMANGEVYFHDGKYFTTVEEDVNPDIE